MKTYFTFNKLIYVKSVEKKHMKYGILFLEKRPAWVKISEMLAFASGSHWVNFRSTGDMNKAEKRCLYYAFRDKGKELPFLLENKPVKKKQIDKMWKLLFELGA